MAKERRLDRAEAALRADALTYPDAVEEFPWDHRAIKVKKKIFLILYRHEGRLGVTVKLPISGRQALALPFVEPTGYGLGKSGWITATFAADMPVPIDMLKEWVDESYRAVAPKKLVAALEADAEVELALKPRRRK